MHQHQPLPPLMRVKPLSRRGPLLAAAGASMLALAIFFPAPALAHHRDGFASRVTPAVAGVVEGEASESGFKVKARGGETVTVTVSSGTTYLEHGVAEPSLKNVQAGDDVAVFGTISGTSVSASQVVIFTPKPNHHGQHPVAVGVVQGEPADESFTIQTRHGQSETVHVSSTTTYCERGESKPSLANVKSGDIVAVFGTASEGSITATTVLVGVPSHRHGGFAVAGTVKEAPSNNAFTITTPKGTSYVIDVSSSTTYFERRITNASLEDVKSGDFVAVFGTVTESTVTATRVLIATPPPTPASTKFATAGTVQTKPSGGSFVIETWNHTQQTVSVGTSTTYSERCKESASLEDVEVGDFVGIYGTVSGSNVTATQVVIGGNGVGGGPGFLARPGRHHRGGHGSGPSFESGPAGPGGPNQGDGSPQEGGHGYEGDPGQGGDPGQRGGPGGW